MKNKIRKYIVLCTFILTTLNSSSQILVKVDSVSSEAEYKAQIKKSNKLLRMIESGKLNRVMELYYSEGGGSLANELFGSYLEWSNAILNNDSLKRQATLELLTHSYLSEAGVDVVLSQTLYIIYKFYEEGSAYMNKIKLVFPLDNCKALDYDFEFNSAEDQKKAEHNLKELGPPKNIH